MDPTPKDGGKAIALTGYTLVMAAAAICHRFTRPWPRLGTPGTGLWDAAADSGSSRAADSIS